MEESHGYLNKGIREYNILKKLQLERQVSSNIEVSTNDLFKKMGKIE